MNETSIPFSDPYRSVAVRLRCLSFLRRVVAVVVPYRVSEVRPVIVQAFAAVSLFLVSNFGRSAEPGRIDFARDIRPILANHCWSCHGPDENTREAGLRLDIRDAALATRPDARPAIVPGRPEASLVIAKIDDSDPESRMPPPAAKRPLSDEQRRLLREWIRQDALFAEHWAFRSPVRPAIPDVRDPHDTRNSLDRFVVRKLDERSWRPAPSAPRETLIRRLSLDLTGLPPSVETADEFLADNGPDAYERMVERLIASPRHAERLAANWLDVARYADTNGYNNDEERTMWPWRDWVIDAFRRQMPFDQFIVEQLAGDQLPNASLSQKVATGFHRNHVLTTEGGIIEEEYRVEYVADRVHTTATVFLGLSLQCARCHDHKYDPFTQRDYYRLFAYFNQLPHQPVGYARGGLADPSIKVPRTDQEAALRAIETRQAELDARRKQREADATDGVRQWLTRLTPDDLRKLSSHGLAAHFPLDEESGAEVRDAAGQPGASPSATEPSKTPSTPGAPKQTAPPSAARIVGTVVREAGRLGGALRLDGKNYVDAGDRGAFEANSPFSLAAWIHPTSNEAGAVLSRMDDGRAFRGYDMILESGRLACHIIDHWPDNGLKVITRDTMPLNAWHHVLVSYDGSYKAAGVHIYVDGKPQTLDVSTDTLKPAASIRTEKPLHFGRRHSSVPFQGLLDDVRLFGYELSADDARRLVAGEPISSLADSVALADAERTPAQRELLRRYYLEHVDAEYAIVKRELAELPQRRKAIEQAIPAVMIMEDLAEPRATKMLKRGQYDQPGDTVTAGIPDILAVGRAARTADSQPTNRLGLAKWLVDPAHPLTARVAVNRWWELYFGLGIVETLEDFGTTGALPSHPELLDWLAVELIRSNWDVASIQRAIVTSSTYRQSARVTREMLERDPKNVWLARGPRFRLSAETVRDNALVISGLFTGRIGGPSVRPYQPEGLWEDVTVERRYKYVPDAGEGLYRRSMYTFWKRTCPPPTMSTFDAPSRETCTIRRARTNSPLQALVLLNDPTYVEAARKFAERTLREANSTAPNSHASDADRIGWAYRAALARTVRPAETSILLETLAEARAKFQSQPADADRLLKVGRSPADASIAPGELAAWTVVCDLLLNLDETFSKP